MKICIIGGLGSIGRRYQSILKFLNIDFDVFDIAKAENPKPTSFDRWLIATPTDTHYDWCMEAIQKRIPFLCEKPLSKNLQECQKIRDAAKAARVQGYVVNNYNMILRSLDFDKSLKITYNYYNTGRDGLIWDCCQLIYRDPEAVILNSSPFWQLWLNHREVAYRDVETSYIKMIIAWLNDDKGWLWDLDAATKMTELVEIRIKKE